MSKIEIRSNWGNAIRTELSLADDIVVHLRHEGFNCDVPTSNVNTESFLMLGVGAYLADRLLSRKECSFDGWERNITLRVPLVNDLFQILPFQRSEPILSLLTGDRWTLSTKQTRARHQFLNSRKKLPLFAGWTICLFSGGQDSLVGAINLLESGERVLLIGRCGFASERGPQGKLFHELKRHYRDKVAYINFNVAPRQDVTIETRMETTFRSRSILFLSFAAFIALGVDASRKIIIPENGFIAQNAPIDSRRTGTLSTRTAHPFYLHHLNNFVSSVGGLSFYNPFETMTKGEMLLQCANPDLLRRLNQFCVSCGKTGRHRAILDRLAVHGKPANNCGVCWPCIIRRSAETHSEISGTRYSITHPKRTMRAEMRPRRFLEDFAMVDAWIQHSPTDQQERQRLLSRMCGIGSLPEEWPLQEYVDVSMRGYSELRTWLRLCR